MYSALSSVFVVRRDGAMRWRVQNSPVQRLDFGIANRGDGAVSCRSDGQCIDWLIVYGDG